MAVFALILGCITVNAKTITVYGQGDAVLGTYANITSVEFTDGKLKFVSENGTQEHTMSNVSYFTLAKDTTTGIAEVLPDNKISVQVIGDNLTISGTSSIGNICVYSSLGYLMSSYNTTETSASLSLPSYTGVLFIVISSNHEVIKVVK